MKDEDCFASLKFVVVGLGLMGGSLALRLKARNQYVMAVDPDPETRKFVLDNKIADRVSAEAVNLIPYADVIVLSAPVDAILAIIPTLPDLHPGSPILLDLGSTKVQICRSMSKLPQRFEAIGGHPVCGKEMSGIKNAAPTIFQGSAFAFTSTNHTTARTKRFADWLAVSLGAYPVWLEPENHDRWVAATSHLPYLISSTLTLVTPLEASSMVGPGFLSSSRLAGSLPSVMLPILETNREFVLESIAHFRGMLDAIEAKLRSEHYSAVLEILDQARRRKAALTTSKNKV